MKVNSKAALAALLALALAPVAYASSPTVIDFDELTPGTIGPTLSYPEVTFSSVIGSIFIEAVYAESIPNSMCPLNVGQFSCSSDLTVDFTKPVNGLTFYLMGEEITNVGTVDVYTNGVFNATVPTVGDGISASPNIVDLTAYSNITKLYFPVPADPSGVLYDTFTFTPVPEPATALMVAIGFAPFFAGRRRRT